MKAKAYIVVCGALMAALLIFAACESPAGGGDEAGVVGLSVGRAVGELWNDMDVSTFKHTIWLYDTATARETELASGVGTGMKNYKITPCSYTVLITARGYPSYSSAAINSTYVVTPGTGVAGDPYIVYDLETLRKVCSDGYFADGDDTTGKWHLGAHYLQAADIALPVVAAGQSNWERMGIFTGTPSSAKRFTGVYDGGGFRIENLTINSTFTAFADNFQGMFGGVGVGGIVKNIALVNVNIRGGNTASKVGGVAGSTLGDDTSIENCYSTGNVSSTSYWIGGVAGTSGVTSSVALNRSVVTADPMVGHENDAILIGRVIGSPYDTVTNNYARGDMTIKYGTNVVKTDLEDTADGMDGESITAAHWHSAEWWQYTLDFSVDVWDLVDGKLPTLKGFSGTQNPVVK